MGRPDDQEGHDCYCVGGARSYRAALASAREKKVGRVVRAKSLASTNSQRGLLPIMSGRSRLDAKSFVIRWSAKRTLRDRQKLIDAL